MKYLLAIVVTLTGFALFGDDDAYGWRLFGRRGNSCNNNRGVAVNVGRRVNVDVNRDRNVCRDANRNGICDDDERNNNRRDDDDDDVAADRDGDLIDRFSELELLRQANPFFSPVVNNTPVSEPDPVLQNTINSLNETIESLKEELASVKESQDNATDAPSWTPPAAPDVPAAPTTPPAGDTATPPATEDRYEYVLEEE